MADGPTMRFHDDPRVAELIGRALYFAETRKETYIVQERLVPGDIPIFTVEEINILTTKIVPRPMLAYPYGMVMRYRLTKSARKLLPLIEQEIAHYEAFERELRGNTGNRLVSSLPAELQAPMARIILATKDHNTNFLFRYRDIKLPSRITETLFANHEKAVSRIGKQGNRQWKLGNAFRWYLDDESALAELAALLATEEAQIRLKELEEEYQQKTTPSQKQRIVMPVRQRAKEATNRQPKRSRFKYVVPSGDDVMIANGLLAAQHNLDPNVLWNAKLAVVKVAADNWHVSVSKVSEDTLALLKAVGFLEGREYQIRQSPGTKVTRWFVASEFQPEGAYFRQELVQRQSA